MAPGRHPSGHAGACQGAVGAPAAGARLPLRPGRELHLVRGPGLDECYTRPLKIRHQRRNIDMHGDGTGGVLVHRRTASASLSGPLRSADDIAARPGAGSPALAPP